MSDDTPKGPQKTPKEALKAIHEAAVEGTIEFDSDVLTTEYDDEIQKIFAVIYRLKTGKPVKHGIWTADGQHISNVLPLDEAGYTAPEGYAICETVSHELGITITPKTLWEDAGAALRALDPARVRS